MRIIAGEWRGRPLKAPQGDTTRPTADRTRETLFSMLTSRLGSFDGLVVADLFAGSGALGLEALSRGAAEAIFVEQDAAALRALRANITNLRAQDRCDVRAASVLALGPARRTPISCCSIRLTAAARARWRWTSSTGSAGSRRARGSAWKPRAPKRSMSKASRSKSRAIRARRGCICSAPPDKPDGCLTPDATSHPRAAGGPARFRPA